MANKAYFYHQWVAHQAGHRWPCCFQMCLYHFISQKKAKCLFFFMWNILLPKTPSPFTNGLRSSLVRSDICHQRAHFKRKHGILLKGDHYRPPPPPLDTVKCCVVVSFLQRVATKPRFSSQTSPFPVAQLRWHTQILTHHDGVVDMNPSM